MGAVKIRPCFVEPDVVVINRCRKAIPLTGDIIHALAPGVIHRHPEIASGASHAYLQRIVIRSAIVSCGNHLIELRIQPEVTGRQSGGGESVVVRGRAVQCVEHRPHVAVLEIRSRERRNGRRRTAKKLHENVARRYRCGVVDKALHLYEIREETITVNLWLVQVAIHEQFNTAIAHIAHLKNHVLAQLPLHIQAVTLHIASPQVRACQNHGCAAGDR